MALVRTTHGIVQGEERGDIRIFRGIKNLGAYFSGGHSEMKESVSANMVCWNM